MNKTAYTNCSCFSLAEKCHEEIIVISTYVKAQRSFSMRMITSTSLEATLIMIPLRQ